MSIISLNMVFVLKRSTKTLSLNMTLTERLYVIAALLLRSYLFPKTECITNRLIKKLIFSLK